MQIDIITLFPAVFRDYLSSSVLGRIQEKGLLVINLHNLRDFAAGKHRITDETPYGGGGGMVLKPEPIFVAVETLLGPDPGEIDKNDYRRKSEIPIILLTPQGRRFKQEIAEELSQEKRILLICGRYEGVDERARQHLATDEISIGDFVMSGGELAALTIVDSVARLLPGALGDESAAQNDSFSGSLLEGPHYTRPDQFRGWSVPDILRSGHAAKIARWRREQALRRTWRRRPELLLRAELTEEDKLFLRVLAAESASDNRNTI
jgi:tRNA (guanine37-N1)-methyltransferase